eukprot:4823318-Pyramimonas_sp.AAC.1
MRERVALRIDVCLQARLLRVGAVNASARCSSQDTRLGLVAQARELGETPHCGASVRRVCGRGLAARVELQTVHHFPRALDWQREDRRLPVVL